jgi:hypothetical protein
MPATLVKDKQHDTDLLALPTPVLGILTDAAAVEYRIMDASSALPGTQILPAAGWSNVVTLGKLSTGKYGVWDTAASAWWTPVATRARAYVEWRWKTTSTSSWQTVHQFFEVVATTVALTQGRALALVQDVVDASSYTDIATILRALREWRDTIERHVGVHYSPVWQSRRTRGRGAEILQLSEPLYGLSALYVNGSTTAATLSDYRVHGYPDALWNPKIEAWRGTADSIWDLGTTGFFSPGWEQTVDGVWGLFDSTTFGPPEPVRVGAVIAGVVMALDAASSGGSSVAGGPLRREKTDYHEVEYAVSASASSSSMIALLRDARIRDVLNTWRRPLGIGAPSAQWG